MFSAAVQ